MELDEELCLCFHVTKRKVVNYLRVEKPQRPGQLADCFGAGTGCGWCRPYLRKLFENARSGKSDSEAASSEVAAIESVDLPSADEYKQHRAAYIKEGKGTPPPGATE